MVFNFSPVNILAKPDDAKDMKISECSPIVQKNDAIEPNYATKIKNEQEIVDGPKPKVDTKIMDNPKIKDEPKIKIEIDEVKNKTELQVKIEAKSDGQANQFVSDLKKLHESGLDNSVDGYDKTPSGSSDDHTIVISDGESVITISDTDSVVSGGQNDHAIDLPVGDADVSSSDSDIPARRPRLKNYNRRAYLFNSETEDDSDETPELKPKTGNFFMGSDRSADEEPDESDLEFVSNTTETYQEENHLALLQRQTELDDRKFLSR